MLLSKGLRFNTYQQMQPIQASANQSSVSLPHTLAGADERKRVSPCREIHTYMKSYVGYASQFTHMWLNISALCMLLSQQACQGWCDRCVLLAASMPTVALLESFNLATISNTTPAGWECHSAFGEGNRRRKSFLDIEALLLECWE